MATFSVDIDDIDVERVLGAICAAYGYDPASGIAQDVYARSALISYIKGLVVNADLAAAQSAALAAIVTPPGVS
jgi:hypothetical protein